LKKFTLVILITFVLALLPSKSSAESLQTKLIPEEANWLIHVDVEKLAQTKLRDIFKDKMKHKLGKEISEIEKTANIDFFEDITAVTAIGMNSDDDEPVIAFSGNLNKDSLLSLLKEKETPEEIQHGRFLIYNWDNDENGVFINDRLLLISENRHGLEKVLDSYAGKGKNISDTSLQPQLQSLSPTAFLVAAAKNISGMTDNDDNDFGAVILKKTKMAFFSAQEKDAKLKFKLSLETDSPETAKNMEGMVTGLKSFLAMHEKIDPEWDLLKNMKISVAGSAVWLESESPVEELLHVVGLKM
jgi:hypothetical protein